MIECFFIFTVRVPYDEPLPEWASCYPSSRTAALGFVVEAARPLVLPVCSREPFIFAFVAWQGGHVTRRHPNTKNAEWAKGKSKKRRPHFTSGSFSRATAPQNTAHVSLSATAQPPHADARHQAWSGATKPTATHPPPLSSSLVKPKTMPPLVRVDAGSEGRNTFLNHALEWGAPAVVLLLLVCILPYALLGAGHTGAGAAAAGSNSPGRARACSA